MRTRAKRVLCCVLSFVLAATLTPTAAFADSAFEGMKPATVLFQGEGGVNRQFVSETEYSLAPGATEYVTYTNEPDGLDQNIDFFCEVDLDQAEIMAGYADMEGILTNNEINWRMQTVSDQAKSAQSYFTRSEDYADATIVAALNADFYNMATGEPTGALVIDGVTYHPSNGRYYFGITKDGDAVISDNSDLSNLQHAVGGANLLVKDGEVNVGAGGRNVTTTAIGIKADGTVVSMVAHGQRYPVSCGYTDYELAQMMKARGCVTALRLDGSGSSAFVSRRDGDSSLVTRNNPSDGQERQVSSSLFIVSREQSDGVFDHAVISPVNEVYTPGSTVQFSAVGADASGAPADLPENLYWSVAAGYGSIDSSTGVFTSTGKTGEVTVSLNSGSDVVGTSTITIANPDQITFAEATTSIGQGEMSDLGLRVYYQQREVHYKDGDFTWTIEPTQYSRSQYVEDEYKDGKFVRHVYETVVETDSDRMQYLTLGTVSDNQLTCDPVYTDTNLRHPDRELDASEKTATAITAKVTVSLKADSNVFGTVALDACKDPLVAMDFEDENTSVFHSFETYAGQFDEDGTWTQFDTAKKQEEIAAEGYGYTAVSYAGRTTDGRQVAKATVVKRADGYPVRFGEQSMRVDYDFSTNTGSTDGACIGTVEDIELANVGNPTRIGIWVYIPKNTPNLWLRLGYRDGSGNASQLDFTENNIYQPNNIARNADDNWHYFEADISHLQTPVTIPAGMSLRVMMANPKQSIGAAKLWASPVGWVKCQTDENGNIILVDKDDERLTQFTGGYATSPINIGEVVPDSVVLSTTGEKVTIGQVPIPEYLATFDSNGNPTSRQNLSGSIYFDNLTYVYGSTPEDTAAPVVEDITVQAGGEEPANLVNGMDLSSGELTIEASFRDSIEDNPNNTGVSAASIYIDNRRLEGATVDLGGGILRGGVKLSNGSHTIRISVVDNYGNEASHEFTVNVNDPNSPAAVTVAATEASAVLGGQIGLEFTPRDTSVDRIEASISVPEEFAQGYELATAEGVTVESESYDAATQTLSFAVTGTVETGAAATLTFNVPTSAAVGQDVTFRINGTAGTESFNATPTWTVSAPYTVTSGTMVVGLDDTCWLQVAHTASGAPASGVTVYVDGTSVGTTGSDGKVAHAPSEGVRSISVYAQDEEGGVSSVATLPVYTPQGNADGTPTHVWQNAADSASELNVSWMTNPLYANDEAYVQIATSEEAVAGSEQQAFDCKLTTFPSDVAAAYVSSALITGLEPGTTYYYRVGDGEHWSGIETYTTTYENTGIDAIVLGDLQENDNDNLQGILEAADVSAADLVVQTGDLVDDGSSYVHWASTLTMLDSLSTDSLFAVGNHEQGSIDVNTAIYNQNDSNYYSIEAGNTFIATFAFNGFTEEALNQMIADAQASDATWKLLVMHQPPYYTNPGAGMGVPTQQQIAAAAETAGIDVVLSGHDHSYARTEPMLGGQVVDVNDGITYFICGSLGEKSYEVTDNPDFNFSIATNDYSAVYLTLSTTDSALTINAYDYSGGSSQLIDTFVKMNENADHEHSFAWTDGPLLTCGECGYQVPSATYTGYATYADPATGESGDVYINAGTLMTGWFAVGEDTLYHAGDNGILHDSETVNTAQCWEDGHIICWCHDCNKYREFSLTRRQGHLYDENHVCTREVFNMDTWRWETCGLQGKDISTLDIKLAYNYGFYDGEERRPAVTVTDVLPDGTVYELFGQSTYGDYMPYWENNVEVGTATVHVVGYSDGPYYGETSVTFQIVPQNLTADDFTVTATSNSAHLTWNEAPGAESYIVYERIEGELHRLGVVTEPEYTATGLSAGTHEFCVRPFATVDGQDYYSTRNSDPVTVTVEEGDVSFEKSDDVVTLAYGDATSYSNPAVSESGAAVSYESSDATVATVDASGVVTIVGAGEALITAKAGDDAAQYRMVVNPKPVEIAWAGAEDRQYDGQPSNVTATASGMINGETAIVTVEGGTEKDAGTHTATAASIDNKNYALPEGASVEYAITPCPITSVTWGGDTLVYTGSPLAPEATAGDGVIAGDTVELTVPTATEPGTYQVRAASDNPNYVVADSVPAHAFSIVMPNIALSVNGQQVTDGSLSAYFDGTTIKIVGSVAVGAETVNVTMSTSASSGSGNIAVGETGTLWFNGVEYTVDATGVLVNPVHVTTSAGETVSEVAKGVIASEALNTARQDEGNKFGSSVFGALEEAIGSVIADAEEKEEWTDATVFALEVFQQITVTAYDTVASVYTVDIVPAYRIGPDNGYGKPVAESAITGTFDDDQIIGPVEVSLVVPRDIAVGESTYVRHVLANGGYEIIKPAIAGQVLTFWTSSFSEFSVVSDARTADVTFTFEGGSSYTQTISPADYGSALPTDEREGFTFNGWTIGDMQEPTKVVTEEFLNALAAGGQINATPRFTEVTEPEPEPEPGPTPGGGGGTVTTYDISIVQGDHGVVSVAPETATVGTTVVVTTTPDEGYAVSTVIAKGPDGAAIEVTDNGDGSYSFVMPNGNVEIAVSFALEECAGGEDCPSRIYSDVDISQWYHSAFDWAIERGVLHGYADTSLMKPTGQITRAEMAQVLWNIEGNPDSTAEGKSFSDVSSDAWYADAIEWATSTGIFNGYGGTELFAPDQSITREETATVLMRWAQMRGDDTTVRGDLSAFPDNSNVSEWAFDAMSWAVATGVINGIDQGNESIVLDPSASTERAQIAMMLMRYLAG